MSQNLHRRADGRRRLLWSVAAVTAAALSATVAGVLTGTGPAAFAAVGASFAQPSVAGRARLQTSSALTVTVPVAVQRDTVVTVVVRMAGPDGRRCSRTMSLSPGSRTVTVACTVTPRLVDVPTLAATVTARAGAYTGYGEQSYEVHWPIADGAPVARAEAARRWHTLTQQLMDRSWSANDATFDAAFASAAVTREVFEEGWSGPHVPVRLDTLLQMAKPGGGYGLARAWDAYGDGTVNPAGTTYTVTSAAHVGDVLLDAYRHGRLDADRLHALVDAVLALPRLDHGRCIAYSDAAADRRKPCVYNVSYGAVAWLAQVRRATGYRAAEIDALVTLVRATVRRGYDRGSGFWPYVAGARPRQDLAHQVYTATSVDVLVPGFGALRRTMERPWWDQPSGEGQPDAVVAAGVIAAAKADCRYARSPAVLVAAERMTGAQAEPFAVLTAANAGRAVLRDCFGVAL